MYKEYHIYKNVEDGQWIQAIKDLRTICCLDLKEAKDIVEAMRDEHIPHIMINLGNQLINDLRVAGFDVWSADEKLPDELFTFGEPVPDKRITYSHGVLQIVTDDFSHSIRLTEQDRIALIKVLND